MPSATATDDPLVVAFQAWLTLRRECTRLAQRRHATSPADVDLNFLCAPDHVKDAAVALVTTLARRKVAPSSIEGIVAALHICEAYLRESEDHARLVAALLRTIRLGLRRGSLDEELRPRSGPGN